MSVKWLVFLTLLLSCLLLPFITSQVNTETSIVDSAANLKTFSTYTRYNNATDNFPISNFSVCIGETNATVHFRFIFEDKNIRSEISNATWKIVSVENGTDYNVTLFGNNSRELTVESNVSATKVSYISNATLEDLDNKTLYKVITNVTDINGNSRVNYSYFTVHQTTCIRVEENASLVESVPFEVDVDYCHLDIVVNENVTGRIIVTLYNESPVDSGSDEAIERYMTVDVEGVILQSAVNLSLLVDYAQELVSDKNLDESTLQIYKFGSWILQNGSVDIENNTVDFLINETLLANQSYRLGTYSVRGETLGSSGSPSGSSGGSSSSSSSSGGGGGGSGSSDSAGFFGSSSSTDISLNPSRDDVIGKGIEIIYSASICPLNYSNIVIGVLICYWPLFVILVILIILLWYVRRQREREDLLFIPRYVKKI